MRIIKLRKTGSTNEYIRRFIKTGKDTAVFANLQTGGKGTKGRSFDSQKGGMYVTLLRFHNAFKAADGFKFMINSSMAAVKTLERFGVSCLVKWPNDIYASGKKICGILTENCIENGLVKYSITGTGINVNNKLNPQLSEAVTVRQIIGKKISLRKFCRAFLECSAKDYTVNEYKEYSLAIGRQVKATAGAQSFEGVVTDITDEGLLCLKTGGGERKFTAAEISIKI